jgi:hypothetical protein
MRLYVWDDYETDYTPGLAFAIAESADHARKLITAEASYPPKSLKERPKSYRLDVPRAFQQSGGS